MPLHNHRVWSIAEAIDPDTLARQLTDMQWTLCQGFRLGEYLLLNDATSEDGAQEYAVLLARNRVQIDSVTFGWMDGEAALGYLTKMLSGAYDNETFGRGHVIGEHQVQPPDHHGTCPLCA